MFGLFVVALAIDFILIAGYFSYVERHPALRQGAPRAGPGASLRARLRPAGRRCRLRLRPGRPGHGRGPVRGRLIVFQYLIGALLLSQQRADELELEAKQLAGFQVALLGALLRTLDLRDRMTARHSAAVARYSREIASGGRALRGGAGARRTPPACSTTSASSSSPTAS